MFLLKFCLRGVIICLCTFENFGKLLIWVVTCLAENRTFRPRETRVDVVVLEFVRGLRRGRIRSERKVKGVSQGYAIPHQEVTPFVESAY